MAGKSSWDQANRRQKLGLVWRIRKKISQIIKDYFYLPFFLLIILCILYVYVYNIHVFMHGSQLCEVLYFSNVFFFNPLRIHRGSHDFASFVITSAQCFPVTYAGTCGSGSAWIRINLSCWIRIRIRIEEGKNDLQT
jgi:hypothetical protein